MSQVRLEVPELALLVECCRWNFAAYDRSAPLQLWPGVDWDLFLFLARFHRVQGLAWNGLAPNAEQFPAAVRELLSAEARFVAATNLAMAHECGELGEAFQQARIPLLFVKGLAVGALAYRLPLLKMGWDIDLLIDPQDLAEASAVLARRGYSLVVPSTPVGLQDWHSRSKESVWVGEGGIHVELHTRLADSSRLIPAIDVHSPQRLVDVTPDIELATLADDELFAYLAVHGASSAWFRLKWISDFAALLHGRSREEIEHRYDRSQQLGAARAAGQALLLADSLFGSLELVPELRARLASDRATRSLHRTVLRMTQRAREPTETRFGTLPIHWTQFLLRPGIGFKVSELRRQAAALFNRAAG